MKTFKRFGAMFLALILALALAVPVLAAVDDTGFSDVDADAWVDGLGLALAPAA